MNNSQGGLGSLSLLLLAQRTSHRRERQFTGTLASFLCWSLRQAGTVAVALGLGSEGTLAQLHCFQISPLCFLIHSKTWKFSSEWVFISGSKL